MTASAHDKFLGSLEDEKAAKVATVSAMVKAFPIGSRVRWKHAGQVRESVVVRHSKIFVSLSVKGNRGAAFWLDAVRCTPVAKKKKGGSNE